MPSSLPVQHSLLMSLITFGDQDYRTSHYFHHLYVEQSPHGGKYRRHADFMRLVRSIDAFQDYCANHDIVELDWSTIKASNDVVKQNMRYWKSLFQAASWKPIILMNATAQLALHERLDDTLSKQISVAKNTQAARQESTVSKVLLAKQDMGTWKELAEMFGAPLHIALQEGVKYVEKTYGLDFRPLLLASPTVDAIDERDMMLEPTDLARYLHYPSGAAMNKALEGLGWQCKRSGQWETTQTGNPHSTRHAWINQGKSGYNIKWNLQAVRAAFAVLAPSHTS